MPLSSLYLLIILCIPTNSHPGKDQTQIALRGAMKVEKTDALTEICEAANGMKNVPYVENVFCAADGLAKIIPFESDDVESSGILDISEKIGKEGYFVVGVQSREQLTGNGNQPHGILEGQVLLMHVGPTPLMNISTSIMRPASVIPATSGLFYYPLMNVEEKFPKWDGSGSYFLTGMVDGMGAILNPDNNTKLWLFVNHEWAPEDYPAGFPPRAHGGKGAYVSKWELEVSTFRVIQGADLIQKMYISDGNDPPFYNETIYNFRRFCSSDLANVNAFYNPLTQLGTQDRIYLTGEETRVNGMGSGMAIGVPVTGVDAGLAFELAHMGRGTWENVVCNDRTADITLCILGDDNSDGSYMYVYIGLKKNDPRTVIAAGLTGGRLFTVATLGDPRDDVVAFYLAEINDPSQYAGIPSSQYIPYADKVAPASIQFNRVEDVTWNKNDRNVVYLAITGEGRIVQLTFVNLDTVDGIISGGNLTTLVSSYSAKGVDQEGYDQYHPFVKPDNMDITKDDILYVCMDPGQSSFPPGIFRVDTKQTPAQVHQIALLNPQQFAPSTPYDIVLTLQSGFEFTEKLFTSFQQTPSYQAMMGTVNLHQRFKAGLPQWTMVPSIDLEDGRMPSGGWIGIILGIVAVFSIVIAVLVMKIVAVGPFKGKYTNVHTDNHNEKSPLVD